ncbi:subtilisin-like protease [Mercurialis annua]|uniref:subtilisin-like protease n=1 Tax=Mercurialis annua TaxID=3986 RepID=UPI00215E893D|nr:subtilisin-like protease [Mercurialis annua]
MENKTCSSLPKIMVIFLVSFISIFCLSLAINEDQADTYIVFLEKPEGVDSLHFTDLEKWHQSLLPVSNSASIKPRIVHHYRNVATGFAAKMSAKQAKSMEEKKGSVSVILSKMLPLYTTHTPSFLGLHQNSGFWKNSSYGKGVIIGVLDTGITPDHPSFSEQGMIPPPAKWKGKCEFNNRTVCNNKLIGARNLVSAGEPPLDDIGHGTHTASTAAGSPVQGASYYGQVNGTAIGIAPLAHLAFYKICGDAGCGEAEVLAAMDAAIEDGVDVISLSLGGESAPFYADVIAIGAYGAIKNGVFVSCAAGNSGPDNSSLSNEAPWILTVGAGTVDRAIRATVLLGNNSKLNGQSLFQPKDFVAKQLPLVYLGGDASRCQTGSLNNSDVKGKIVLCDRGRDIEIIEKGQEVKNNGGAAMILVNDHESGYDTSADLHVLPASHVDYVDGLVIKAYLNTSSSPEATIFFQGTVTGLQEAPQVATFSSRGPSQASPGILKPDIIGPGVKILAAWPESTDNSDKRFNMISGTSMSCPHLTGVAALLKSAHPDWSPAAIKSAIMTTSSLSTLSGNPISDQQFVAATVFDIGAGHVNPTAANSPGLVYDIQPEDYIPYLRGLGYSDSQVGLIVHHTAEFSDDSSSSIPEAQLNYPSFSIKMGSDPQTYTRTVTNVGVAGSSFNNEITPPQGIDIRVTPDKLVFNAVNQKATYSVTFTKNGNVTGSFSQGYLTWKTNLYTVRSPIAVIFA